MRYKPVNFGEEENRCFSSLLLSSLKLSDTKVYEHQIRALLGTVWNRTASHHTVLTPQTYLAQSFNQMVLESQLPHTIVNLLFRLVIVNNKSTILWES